MKKIRWIPATALVVFIALTTLPGTARQAAKGSVAKIPHKIVSIIEKGFGKVEVDLTSKEIVVANTQQTGFLILRLFKDFAPVRVPDFVYSHKDPVRVPLQGNCLYVVTVSTELEFAAATFQLVKEKLHIIKQD